jgi:hypothetical protein
MAASRRWSTSSRAAARAAERKRQQRPSAVAIRAGMDLKSHESMRHMYALCSHIQERNCYYSKINICSNVADGQTPGESEMAKVIFYG